MALGDLGKKSYEERLEFYRTTGFNKATDSHEADRLGRVQWLRAEHDARPFRKFLDIGCHDGFTSRWLIDTYDFGCLVGIDINEGAIQQAETWLGTCQYPERAIYISGPYEKANLVSKFDGISAFEIIEHVLEDEASHLIKYMWDHLSPGGRMLISTPDENGRWGKSNPDECHCNLYNMARLLGHVKHVTGADPEPIGYQPGVDFLYVRACKEV